MPATPVLLPARRALRARSTLLAIFALLAPLACDAKEAGYVALHFRFEERPSETVYLWLEVEERVGDGARVLGGSGPFAFDGSAALQVELPEIPVGDSRVVVVEVRKSAEPNALIVANAVSAPFSIRAGERTEVEIIVPISPPRSAHPDNRVWLSLGKSSGEAARVVNDEMRAELFARTHSTGATTVVLSNDPSFARSRASIAIDSASCVIAPREDGLAVADCGFAWDPLSGVDDVGDGTYSVFAKFLDEDGYESEVVRTEIAIDRTPPTVLGATVSRAIVRPGDAFFITVSLSEPLSEVAGAVSASAIGLDGVELGAPQRLQDSASYVWQGIVPAGAGDGAVTFAVKLADQLGNQGDPVPLITDGGAAVMLTIDGASPAVVGAVPSGESSFVLADLDDGTGYALEIELSEASPSEALASCGDSCEGVCAGVCPRVTIGALPLGVIRRLPDRAGASAWRFEYTPSLGDFGPVERQLEVRVTWQDAAGNTLDQVVGAPLTIDFAPPTATCRLEPNPAAANDVVRFSVEVSELMSDGWPRLAVVPGIGLGGSLFEAAPEVRGGGLVFEYRQLASGLGAGDFDVAVELRDLAGNLTESACAVAGAIDALPLIVGASVSASVAIDGLPVVTGGVARDGAEVHVDVTTDQPVAMVGGVPALDVTVAGQAASFVAKVADAPHTYRFAFTVDAGEVPEGFARVAVDARDDVGNRTFLELGLTSLRFDFTAPGAIDPITLATDPPHVAALQDGADEVRAAAGATVAITFALLEPVRAAPLVELRSGTSVLASLTAPRSTPGQIAFEIAIGSEHRPEADGAVDVFARVTDVAGNPAEIALGTIHYDTRAPTVASFKALGADTFNVAKKSEHYRFELTLAEIAPAAGLATCAGTCPTVRVDGALYTLTRKPSLDAPGVWGFDFDLAVAELGDIQRAVPIVIGWSDAAGNALSQEVDSLSIDFVRPTAVCQLRPLAASAADVMRFSAEVSEPLQAGWPKLTVTSTLGALFQAAPVRTGQTWEWSQSAATLGTGSYTVRAELIDEAGNGALADCSGAGTVDARPAQVLSSLVEASAPNPFTPSQTLKTGLVARDNAVVAIELETNEPAGIDAGGVPTIDVLVGAERASFVSIGTKNGHPYYRYTYVVDDARVDDGFARVSAVVRDAATNVTNADLGLLRYDFVAPRVFEPVILTTDPPNPAALTDLANEVRARSDVPVQVSFVLQEVARRPVTMRLERTDGTVVASFAATSASNDDVSFQASVAPSFAPGDDGDVVVKAVVADEAGNLATLTLGTIHYDDTAPALGQFTRTSAATFNLASVPGTYTFDMLLTEVAPAVGLDTCAGTCPTVSIDGARIGAVTRKPSLDRADAWGFSYSLDVAALGTAQREVAVAIEWSDAAGNVGSADVDDFMVDLVPPTAASCRIDPAVGDSADVFRLTLDVSEPLSATPVLAVTSTVGTIFQTAPTVRADGRSYEWTQAAAGLGDGSFSLSTTLVDAAGNPGAAPVCALSATVDAKAPVVVGHEVKVTTAHPFDAGAVLEPDRVANDGATIAVDVITDELAAESGGDFALEVTVGGVRADFIERVAGPIAGQHRYRTRLVVDDQVLAEGFAPVTVDIRDAAGNRTIKDLGLVRIDYTPPAAFDPVIVATNPPHAAAVGDSPSEVRARPDAQVTVSFILQEAAIAPVTVRLKQGATVLATIDATDATTGGLGFEVPIDPEHAPADDGDVAIEVTLADVAGNDTTLTLGVIHYDSAPPIVTSFTRPGSDTFNIASSGSSYTFDLVLAEPAPATFASCTTTCPRITVGGQSVGQLQRKATLDTPGQWGFSYTLQASTLGAVEGTLPVTVQWSDAAGNALTDELETIDVDFVRPTAVGCRLDPEIASEIDVIRLTIDVSEPMKDGWPKLTVESDIDDLFGGTPQVRTQGRTYEWTQPATGLGDGTFEVEAEIVDVAGNAGSVNVCALSGALDAKPVDIIESTVAATTSHPFIPNVTLETGLAARDGATIDIRLTTDEPARTDSNGKPDLVVRVGNKTATFEEVIALDPVGFQFTYTYVVDADVVDEGIAPVSVDIRDIAGNRTVADLGMMRFDFTPPGHFAPATFTSDNPYSRSHGTLANEIWARADTSVSVSFILKEPTTDAIPILLADAEGIAVDATVAMATDGFSVAGIIAGSSNPLTDGDRKVVAQVIDLAGNGGQLELGTIHFDYAAPAAIDAAAQESTTLFRAPYGIAETGGASVIELRACPQSSPPATWRHCPAHSQSAIDPDTEVSVFRAIPDGDSWSCSSIALAAGVTDATGAVAIGLLADVPAICIALTDRAGNVSEKRLVDRVEWALALGTSQSISPLRGFMTSRFEPQRHQPRDWREDFTPGDLAGLELIDGVVAATTARDGWFERKLGAPSEPSNEAIYDAAHGRIIRMGSPASTGETWAWTTRGWEVIVPDAPQLVGRAGTLVYDEARETTVFFTLPQKEVWELRNEQWVRVPQAGSPSSVDYRAEYDPELRRILVVGGPSAPGGPGAAPVLHSWDGETWTELAGTYPDEDVHSNVMAYHRGRKTMLVWSTDYWDHPGFWEWDHAEWRVAFGPPGSRSPLSFGTQYTEQLVYDEALDRLHLSREGLMWSWDGRRWDYSLVSEGGGGSLVYHRARGATMALATISPIGECGSPAECAIVREWVPEYGWRKLYSGLDDAPSPRWRHATAYDPVRGVVVLFGGQLSEDRSDVDAQTWEWDGEVWRRLHSVNQPRARAGHALAYDNSRRRVVMYGGEYETTQPGIDCIEGVFIESDFCPGGDEFCGYCYLTDTWEWDGRRWEQVCGAECTSPGPLAEAVATGTDNGTLFIRRAELAWGGYLDTAPQPLWRWDGTSWSVVATADGFVESIAWHKAEDVVYFTNTWEDQSGWYPRYGVLESNEFVPTSRLSPSLSAIYDNFQKVVLAYDHASQRMIGVRTQRFPGDNLTFTVSAPYTLRNGLVTANNTVGIEPFARGGAAITSTSRGVAAIGGLGPGSVTEQSLAHGELIGRFDARPAHIVELDLADAGAGTGLNVLDVSVNWWAGASSAGTDGARLLHWNGGEWVARATNASGISHPSALTWRATTPAETVRAFTTARGTLSIAAVPHGSSGIDATPATVASDSIEVRITYSLTTPGACPASADCSQIECGAEPICGTFCGGCGEGLLCHEGQCLPDGPDCPADADCDGMECGADPVCGVSCGTCGSGSTCGWDGSCHPSPEPNGYCQSLCDDFPCQVVPYCGLCECQCEGCPDGLVCTSDQQCVYESSPGFDCPADNECQGRECGLDPVCGVECGRCAADERCDEGSCHAPSCPEDAACGSRECGPDPVCGENCGTCDDTMTCDQGYCVPLQCPKLMDCSDRECGLDPVCGESCGTCPDMAVCSDGTCVPRNCPEDADCTSRECGLDPVCGENCGSCSEGLSCVGGICTVYCGDRDGDGNPFDPGEGCDDSNQTPLDGCDECVITEWSHTSGWFPFPRAFPRPDSGFDIIGVFRLDRYDGESNIIHSASFSLGGDVKVDGGPAGFALLTITNMGLSWGIEAHLLDGDGVVLVSPIVVRPMTNAGDLQYEPVALADGGLAATWIDNAGVWKREFAPNGEPRESEVSLHVNTLTSQDVRATRLANGDYVVCWTLQVDSSTPQFGACRSVDVATGSVSPSFTATATGFRLGDVTSDLAGNMLVVSYLPNRIIVRRLDIAGVQLGSDVVVEADNNEGNLYYPVVAAAPNGGFAVAWQAGWNSLANVWWQAFDSDGIPRTEAERVNRSETHGAHQPGIAIFDDNSFITLFVLRERDAFQNAVVGIQRFDAEGTRRYR